MFYLWFETQANCLDSKRENHGTFVLVMKAIARNDISKKIVKWDSL